MKKTLWKSIVVASICAILAAPVLAAEGESEGTDPGKKTRKEKREDRREKRKNKKKKVADAPVTTELSPEISTGTELNAADVPDPDLYKHLPVEIAEALSEGGKISGTPPVDSKTDKSTTEVETSSHPSNANSASSDESCVAAVKKYFADPSKPEVQEFLSIQARLTTQRLAYAYVTAIQGSENGEALTFQAGILKLIQEKNADKYAEIAKEFDGPKGLSRAALAKVAPYVSEILRAQEGQDSPFVLGVSDLKFLDMVGQSEIQDGRFAMTDERSKAENARSSKSIMNFAKLVNASIRDRETSKESAAAAKKKMQAQLQSLDSQLKAVSKKIAGLIPECKPENLKALCDNKDGSKSLDALMQQCAEVSGAIYEGIFKGGPSDTDRLKAIRYGSFWANTYLKKSASNQNTAKTQVATTTADRSPKSNPSKGEEYFAADRWGDTNVTVSGPVKGWKVKAGSTVELMKNVAASNSVYPGLTHGCCSVGISTSYGTERNVIFSIGGKVVGHATYTHDVSKASANAQAVQKAIGDKCSCGSGSVTDTETAQERVDRLVRDIREKDARKDTQDSTTSFGVCRVVGNGKSKSVTTNNPAARGIQVFRDDKLILSSDRLDLGSCVMNSKHCTGTDRGGMDGLARFLTDACI